MGKMNKDVKAIMQEVDYGDIYIKLDDILTTRGISTYELSEKANIRFQTIQTLRENKSTRIDFGVLAKICYVLECKVEDVIEYREK